MNRIKLNYIVDVLMAVFFVLSTVTGIPLYLIPGGIYRGGLTIFLGIEKHTWGTLHTYTSFALVAVVAIHLILHWNWLVCMTKKFFGKKKRLANDFRLKHSV